VRVSPCLRLVEPDDEFFAERGSGLQAFRIDNTSGSSRLQRAPRG